MAQVGIRLYWNLAEEPKHRFASVPTLCFISNRELKAFGKGEPMMAYAHANECREYSKTTGAIVAVEVRLSGSIAGFGREK
jgi:hypothetical protein